MNDYNLKKSLGFKLDRAARLTTLNFNKNLKENNVTLTAEQWGIINFLLEKDGINQNQIGKLINKDHTCVSRLVDTLIKKGIIEKNISAEDKRVNLIYLTEAGKNYEKILLALLNIVLIKFFKMSVKKKKKFFQLF